MKTKKEWERELTEEGLPPLLPWREVAKLTGVSLKSLARWRADGRLTVLKTSTQGSGRVLVARSEVARLLASLAHGGAA